jgi:S-layer protein
VNATELQGLYLAYFGRPADTEGLAFYTSDQSIDLWQIAGFFSASNESQSLFAGATTADVIDSIYMNLFNRHAEADGLQFWTNAVDSGKITSGQAAYAILTGAQIDDKVTIDNKIAACSAFTDALAGTHAYVGEDAAAYARSIIHGVDNTALSTATAVGLAGDYVAQLGIDHSIAGPMVTVTDPTRTDYLEIGTSASGIELAGGMSTNDRTTIGDVHSGQTVVVDGPAVNSIAGLALQVFDADDTAADVVNLKLNPDFTDNNNATAGTTMSTPFFSVDNIEHLHIESTGHLVTDLSSKADGWQADNVLNHVTISGNSLQSVVVTGDQAFELLADSAALRTVDASALHASPQMLNGPFNAAFSFTALEGAPTHTIIGSADSSNWIQGNSSSNLIVGGSQDDTLTGGGGGDTLTGEGGNDIFSVGTIGPVVTDTITDFHANTVGNGAAGAVDSTGAADASARNGDVINLAFPGAASGLSVTIAADHAQAMQQMAGGDGSIMKAALDASTGMLYVDWNGDGAVDSQVELVGVTTIDAAAFLVNAPTSK